MGDFTYTLMGWAAGVVLSIIVSVGFVHIARLCPCSRLSVVCDFFALSCFDILIGLRVFGPPPPLLCKA